MTPPHPAYVDFETRSRASLKQLGGRRYVAHESTEVVCGVLRLPDGEDVLVSPFAPEDCQVRVSAEADGYLLDVRSSYTPPRLECVAAHNGVDFDRHVWRKLGWPEPREWIDTSYLARMAGMPQASLEWLAANLLGRPKDLEGSKLTKSLSAISRAKKTVGEYRVALTPEVLERVLSYCWLDVDLLPDLWDQWLAEWYGADCPGYEAAWCAMNDRGVEFDVELARDLLEADGLLAQQACEAAGVTQSLVRSGPQLLAEFTRLGCPVDNCQADTFDALLLDPELPKPACLLIRARQACSSIAAGKLRAAIARTCPDGRLRDLERIYGAHTGRGSGRGPQFQNLAKGPGLDVAATLQLFDRGELKAVHLAD